MDQALALQQCDILRAMLGKTATLNLDRVKSWLNRIYDGPGNPLWTQSNFSSRHSGLRALHFAAGKGDLVLVKLLLIYGADINGRDLRWRTPLFYACETPNGIAIAQYLIAAGAATDLTDIDGATVLLWVMRHGSKHEGIAKLLIMSGANLHSRNSQGETNFDRAIWRAAWHASAAALKLLVEAGFDLEERDETGSTVLLKALRLTDFQGERALLLIASGAHVNAQNFQGHTPLHAAVSTKKSSNVVDRLLAAGANMLIRDHDGQLALDIAVTSNQKETIKVFLQYGVDLNAFDSSWEPVLIHSIVHGHISMSNSSFQVA